MAPAGASLGAKTSASSTPSSTTRAGGRTSASASSSSGSTSSAEAPERDTISATSPGLSLKFTGTSTRPWAQTPR